MEMGNTLSWLSCIIEWEKCALFNLLNSHRARENEVGTYVVGDVWTVYATDERATTGLGKTKRGAAWLPGTILDYSSLVGERIYRLCRDVSIDHE